MVKRKLGDVVDESSADQEIRKSNMLYITKSGGLHLAELGLRAGRPSGRRNLGKACEILKACCGSKYSIFHFV